MHGRLLRFQVNWFIKLKPNLKEDFQFCGVCPKTGKVNGIIVDEYRGSIELPYLKQYFTGPNVCKTFQKFMTEELSIQSPPRRSAKIHKPTRTSHMLEERLQYIYKNSMAEASSKVVKK